MKPLSFLRENGASVVFPVPKAALATEACRETAAAQGLPDHEVSQARMDAWVPLVPPVLPVCRACSAASGLPAAKATLGAPEGRGPLAFPAPTATRAGPVPAAHLATV